MSASLFRPPPRCSAAADGLFEPSSVARISPSVGVGRIPRLLPAEVAPTHEPAARALCGTRLGAGTCCGSSYSGCGARPEPWRLRCVLEVGTRSEPVPCRRSWFAASPTLRGCTCGKVLQASMRVVHLSRNDAALSCDLFSPSIVSGEIPATKVVRRTNRAWLASHRHQPAGTRCTCFIIASYARVLRR
jgi:hypothetical protein